MANIHIVNGQSAAGTLKFILKKEKIDNANNVFCFNDLLSTGPVFRLETSNGLQQRRNYILKLLSKVNPNYSLDEFVVGFSELKELNTFSYDRIIIWYGNNAPEILLKLICCKLFPFEKLFEVAISNLHTTSLVPRSMGECNPKTMVTLFENSINKISQEDYYENIINWNKITLLESNLRILNHGKIESVAENYFDQKIINQCTTDFTNALKIVGIVLGKSNQFIGDTYIIYRLLFLIETNKLKYKGVLTDIHSLLVKK